MERRHLDFKTFDDVLADIEQLHSSGYSRAGNWNLAQTLQHLRLTMESATQKKDLKIPGFVKWILRKLFLAKILSARRMKAGFQTSPALLPDQSESTEDSKLETQEVSNFKECVENFMSHAGEYCDNPAFGKLSRSEWQELQLVHAMHHLSFLRPKE